MSTDALCTNAHLRTCAHRYPQSPLASGSQPQPCQWAPSPPPLLLLAKEIWGCSLPGRSQGVDVACTQGLLGQDQQHLDKDSWNWVLIRTKHLSLGRLLPQTSGLSQQPGLEQLIPGSKRGGSTGSLAHAGAGAPATGLKGLRCCVSRSPEEESSFTRLNQSSNVSLQPFK